MKSRINKDGEQVDYFIDNKKVDEKTYYDLQENEFRKNTNVIPLKWKNVAVSSGKKPEISEDSSEIKAKYISKLLKDIYEAETEEDALEILRSEFTFQTTQAYYQAEIDINKVYLTMMKTNLRTFENALEDFIDENGESCEDDLN